MNKKLLKYSFIVFFITTSGSFAKLPNWVLKPQKNCEKNEICAIGSGNNLNAAKSDAKSGIQKTFETQIKSNFNSKLSSSNNEVNDYASESVQEHAEGILNGVEITETYEEKGKFYAFAVLNKDTYAQSLKSDIEKLDKKLKIVLSDKTFSRSKAKKFYAKREALNKRYLFLTGEEIPEKTSYSELFKKKNVSQSESFYIDIKEEDGSLASYISELLIQDYNARIVSSKSEAKNILKGSIAFKKEFLNVNGFEKYSATLKLESRKNNSTINAIHVKVTETGVDRDQIYSKCIDSLKKSIDEKIDDLIN